MKLEQYPKYKDSGLPWVEKIPRHWDIKRNKYILFESNERSVSGDEDLLTVSQYTGVTKRKDKIVDEKKLITNAESLVGYRLAKPNDIVMNIMLAWNGSLGVSNYYGIVSPAYCVYRPKGHIESKYFHYLFRTSIFTGLFKTYSTGIVESRLRLYPDVFFRLNSIIPSESEQKQIVKFLDSKCARIVKFIHNKRRLIKLLKEQKQIIINQAVTRGIDPNVKLKPNGVNWLGDIPDHWKTRRLRTVAFVRPSGVDKITNEGEIPVKLCNYVDVYKNERILDSMDFMHATATPDEIANFELRGGDVLITKDSEMWNDIAVPAFVPEKTPGVICAYHLAIVRPRDIDGEFLSRAFLLCSG